MRTFLFKATCYLSLVWIVGVPVRSQIRTDTALPPSLQREIATGEPIQTQQRGGGVFGPIICDGNGAIYLRVMDQPLNAIQLPVSKIDSHGQVTVFRGSAIPDLKGQTYILSYAVDPGGRIFELVRGEDDPDQVTYLVALTDRGEFTWKRRILLGGDLVSVFLPLRTGEFLIGGTTVTTTANPKPQNFSGIYSQDGELAHSLYTASTDKKSRAGLNTVQFGLMGAVYGGDGNIYLLDPSSPPQVNVLSASGNLLRTFKLSIPFEQAQPEDIFASGTNLAVVYDAPAPKVSDGKKQPQTALALYSSQDGSLIAIYRHSVKGMLACIENRRVTFLKMGANGKFDILRGDL